MVEFLLVKLPKYLKELSESILKNIPWVKFWLNRLNIHKHNVAQPYWHLHTSLDGKQTMHLHAEFVAVNKELCINFVYGSFQVLKCLIA